MGASPLHPARDGHPGIHPPDITWLFLSNNVPVQRRENEKNAGWRKLAFSSGIFSFFMCP